MYLNSWILGLSDEFFSLYLEESMGILVSIYAKKWKFLILFNKFFCVQVKVHWLGPIVKWYTLVYESTP